MSEQDRDMKDEYDSESAFVDKNLKRYAEAAYEQIAHTFLGENADTLRERFEIVMRRGADQSGNIIPTAIYDAAKDGITLIVEPEPVIEYASNLTDEINHEVEEADMARVLVGSGVARTILGYKTAYSDLTGTANRQRYMELICSKEHLWEETATFDDTYGTNLRLAVERMGDDQIPRVNMLRFAIGASLRYMSDVPQLQRALVDRQREELINLEAGRDSNLRLNVAWLMTDNAYRIYDDCLPEIEFAFSFPMSPAEEQQFIDY